MKCRNDLPAFFYELDYLPVLTMRYFVALKRPFTRIPFLLLLIYTYFVLHLNPSSDNYENDRHHIYAATAKSFFPFAFIVIKTTSMKRSFLVFSIFAAGSLFFTSCNKNLKDDVKSLKSQVEELKKHNSELQEKVTGFDDVLGTNEPIIATTTYTDDDNKTRTVKNESRFKASGANTHSLINNGDGTYDIYIERFSDVNWDGGAWVAFTYNPTTKELTDQRGGHYWDDADPYYDNIRYTRDYTSNGLTVAITLKSIDLNTGDIALAFSASATGEFTSANPYYYVPNAGAPVSTTFEFAGKLRPFSRD